MVILALSLLIFYSSDIEHTVEAGGLDFVCPHYSVNVEPNMVKTLCCEHPRFSLLLKMPNMTGVLSLSL